MSESEEIKAGVSRRGPAGVLAARDGEKGSKKGVASRTRVYLRTRGKTRYRVYIPVCRCGGYRCGGVTVWAWGCGCGEASGQTWGSREEAGAWCGLQVYGPGPG